MFRKKKRQVPVPTRVAPVAPGPRPPERFPVTAPANFALPEKRGRLLGGKGD